MLEPAQISALTRLLPAILEAMAETRPKIGGSTLEDRAMSASELKGWEDYRDGLQSLVRPAPQIGEQTGYLANA